MIKIGISGKVNSGKNTLASFLAHNLMSNDHSKFEILAFADKIKEIILQMFLNAQKECLFGPSELRKQPVPNLFECGNQVTHRDLLLKIGKMGRNFDENFWINHVDDKINRLKKQLVIISDARFANEFSYLKKNNFFLIRIRRNESPNINDISETEQNIINDDQFDYVIDNSGTLQDLKDVVKTISEHIIKVQNGSYLSINNTI